MFVNEFKNDKDGSKLGFAYAIESASPETPIMAKINGATKDFNSEQDGGWLIYYEKGDSFYIGSIWKNGYKTTVTDRSCFYNQAFGIFRLCEVFKITWKQSALSEL